MSLLSRSSALKQSILFIKPSYSLTCASAEDKSGCSSISTLPIFETELNAWLMGATGKEHDHTGHRAPQRQTRSDLIPLWAKASSLASFIKFSKYFLHLWKFAVIS